MTKNTFLWITVLILISVFGQKTASAQSKNQREKESFADKLVYGGSFGLQFGSLTLVDVSPVIGYRITEKLEAGLGFTYKYYKYKDRHKEPSTLVRPRVSHTTDDQPCDGSQETVQPACHPGRAQGRPHPLL